MIVCSMSAEANSLPKIFHFLCSILKTFIQQLQARMHAMATPKHIKRAKKINKTSVRDEYAYTHAFYSLFHIIKCTCVIKMLPCDGHTYRRTFVFCTKRTHQYRCISGRVENALIYSAFFPLILRVASETGPESTVCCTFFSSHLKHFLMHARL